MFASRAVGVADRAGCQLQTVADQQAAAEVCQDLPPAVVVLDLAAGLDPAAVRTALLPLAASGCRWIAYAAHVHQSQLDLARRAGWDEVYSRGQFAAQMGDLLSPRKL